MKPAIFIGLLLILVIAGLGITFHSKEKFVNVDNSKRIDSSGSRVSTDIMDIRFEKPFATTPIQNVDDYEYNLVFQNEGEKALTKGQRDMLMSQYPMDWSTQPPSSSVFQKGLANFKESFENKQSNPPGNPYKEIDGTTMIPPDTLTVEQKEKEILATYVPKKPGELTTYDAADAKALIEKIYDAKGMVPDYLQKKPGVFVVTGTRRKDEKVVYEDEVPDQAPTASGAVPSAGERPASDRPTLPPVGPTPSGEGTITVPPVSYETSVGLDPFFTAGAKTRDGKWDYTSWTPGLERMFAPTEPRTNWY